MILNAIIPHMSSNNTPAPFVASTSNQLATYAPFNAFQDNGGAWISDVANSYITIDLGRPYKVGKVFIDTVSSWTGASMKTLTLLASKDGATWVTLYSGATSGYKYETEKDFGIYRYWRVKAGNMTMRGGCVRYFQLYGASVGFVDVDINNIWVTANPTVISGKVYAELEQTDVRVLINDEVADDWHTFNDVVDIAYEYEPSAFQEGGNVITVETRNLNGTIDRKTFLVYKLNLELYKFNTSTYDFRIKNSPAKPSVDAWLGQNYVMDYLNSELGVSYIFRFKPFGQVDSRIEDHPRLFDRVLKENYDITSDQMLGERRRDRTGIKQEVVNVEVSNLLDTLKSEQFKYGFKDIGLIQHVFASWAAINNENIGKIYDPINSAMKKLKASQDVLQLHRLNARRKNMIKNALTVIQGYEHSVKKTEIGIIEYYRMMQDIYPYQEAIIGGLLINGIAREMIALKYPYYLNADKENAIAHSYPDAIKGSKADYLTIIKEYVGVDVIRDDRAIISEVLLSSPFAKDKVYVAGTLNSAEKQETYGVKDWLALGITEDGQGTLYDVLLTNKNEDKQTHSYALMNAHKDAGENEARILDILMINKGQQSKEFRIDSVAFVNKLDSDAHVENLRQYIEKMPTDVLEKSMPMFIDKMWRNSSVTELIVDIEKFGKDVRLTDIAEDFFDKSSGDALTYLDDLYIVSKLGKSSDVDIMQTLFNKQDKQVWDLDSSIIRVDKLPKDIRFDQSVLFTQKMDNKEGWPIFTETLVDHVAKDTNFLVTESFTDMIAKDARNLHDDLPFVDKLSHLMFHDEMIRTVDKLEKEAFIITIMSNFNKLDKAMIIHNNWELAKKYIQSAKAIDDKVRFGDKEEKFTYLYEEDLAYIEDKKAIIIDQLLLDRENLDGYVMDLIKLKGSMSWDKVPDNESIKLEDVVSDKDVAMAYVQNIIDSNRKNEEKEGYIPPETFVLAGDGSEWEDIWDRYSPGVDILDPPDSDYDYSKLAPAIYDMKTGVPKHPIGPSNKADVYVQSATSHPIPENNTVGVDDTKRIAVDNYIFIDTVLALESIKNRNKLRYAGMPVGKAIKEVFSQLFTWIQQAAPGHEEYERMFRFSRWYAEAVVLRNSKQILHRIYNPWQSTLHMGTGLGIDHTKAGWSYMTGTGTLETTTLSGTLTFEKENYIDSEFVLRGYFDNPASQGTMEISVDGVVVDSFSTHGVYERKIEIPQGHHSYRIFFFGTSGTAAISSIEIGGTNFVSAHTTSDDSDVNGLKALTELMAQLLGYFELHHGGRKIKGTMEVRQRAVWNTHT